MNLFNSKQRRIHHLQREIARLEAELIAAKELSNKIVGTVPDGIVRMLIEHPGEIAATKLAIQQLGSCGYAATDQSGD